MLSMTGFGRSEKNIAGKYIISAEVSSINRKQLELRLSIPQEYSVWELDLRTLAAGFFSRGAVSIRVAVKGVASSGRGAVLPEQDKFDEVIKFAVEARRRNGLSGEVNVEALLAMSGLLQHSFPEPEDDGVKEAFLEVCREACINCRSSREMEGNALKEEFSSRISQLESRLEVICGHLPEIVEVGKKRLLEKIAELKLEIDPQDSSFLREVIYLTDKSDVTEEVVRLKSHFVQFRKYLAADAPCGRNLDFLAQEMFREINTLGNKSGNSAISPEVVVFKTELEKIREQIQNVE